MDLDVVAEAERDIVDPDRPTESAPRPDDAPAVEFAREAAELAPEVDVRVLAIGKTLELEAAP